MEATVEMEEKAPFVINIELDAHQNVITKWESRAKQAGLPEAVRNYLMERIVSHRLDCSEVKDGIQHDKIVGRINELRELLVLFSV